MRRGGRAVAARGQTDPAQASADSSTQVRAHAPAAAGSCQVTPAQLPFGRAASHFASQAASVAVLKTFV